MTTEELGVRLVDTGDKDIIETAVWAESLGYDSAWLSEAWGYDALVKLAEAAVRTSSIELGTSIVNVYSRTPAVLAMASASLAEASDNRFTLGIGASHPEFVEDLHGLEYERPLRYVHETVELLREFTGDADTVEYDGEVLRSTGYPPLDHDIPVYNAALGPANCRLTGRLCDGWIPNNIPIHALEQTYETVAEAARDAGRNPGEITVVPWITVAVADDPDDARDAMRRHFAVYLGRYDAYRSVVAEQFPEVKKVGKEWESGDRTAAANAITDDILDSLSVVGSPSTVRERMQEIASWEFVDQPVVVPPGGADAELTERTIEALSPEYT